MYSEIDLIDLEMSPNRFIDISKYIKRPSNLFQLQVNLIELKISLIDFEISTLNLRHL